MRQDVEVPVAVMLWTFTAAMTGLGVVTDLRRVMFVAIMLGLVSCVTTGHIMLNTAVRRERVRLERLVDGIIARAKERAGREVSEQQVPRIR